MAKNGDVSSTKKVASKKKTVKKSVITREEKVLEKLLIENFISMQKVMSSLVVKFDRLSNQVEGLLTLFEDSAKAVAQKEINLELKGDVENQQEVLEKLKLLLDQNKLIAKGITLVHENSRGPTESVANEEPKMQEFAHTTPITSVPESVEHGEVTPGAVKPSVFSMSKNTSPESTPKAMEEEGDLPPRPSFSI